MKGFCEAEAMIFILLLFYAAFVAIIAAGFGMVLRMILPGFPFWLCFLVAFRASFSRSLRRDVDRRLHASQMMGGGLIAFFLLPFTLFPLTFSFDELTDSSHGHRRFGG